MPDEPLQYLLKYENAVVDMSTAQNYQLSRDSVNNNFFAGFLLERFVTWTDFFEFLYTRSTAEIQELDADFKDWLWQLKNLDGIEVISAGWSPPPVPPEPDPEVYLTVHYEWSAAEGETIIYPTDIELPNDGKFYDEGETILLADIPVTRISQKEGVPGTWTLLDESWIVNPSEISLNPSNPFEGVVLSNATITGIWDFEPTKYSLYYDWRSNNHPADAILPPSLSELDWHEEVTLDSAPTTTQQTGIDGTPGSWSFISWEPNEGLEEEDDSYRVIGNTIVFGNWEFYPSTYTVGYDFTGDVLPPEYSSLIPIDSNEYEYGSNVQLIDPYEMKVVSESSVWTFNGWTEIPSTLIYIEENLFIYGDSIISGSWSVEEIPPEPEDEPEEEDTEPDSDSDFLE